MPLIRHLIMSVLVLNTNTSFSLKSKKAFLSPVQNVTFKLCSTSRSKCTLINDVCCKSNQGNNSSDVDCHMLSSASVKQVTLQSVSAQGINECRASSKLRQPHGWVYFTEEVLHVLTCFIYISRNVTFFFFPLHSRSDTVHVRWGRTTKAVWQT